MGEIRITHKCKVWLECDGKPLLGEGRYMLLKHIHKTHSLKKSADILGISYKTAYNYIRRMEKNLGRKIIITQKGGRDAGGSTALNDEGMQLIARYEEVAGRSR